MPAASDSARLVALNAPLLCEIAPVDVKLTFALLTLAARLIALLLPTVVKLIVPVPAAIA